MKKPRLLIIDDAVNLTLFYQQEFEDDGYRVDIANSTGGAAKLLNSNTYDLVIVEPTMMEMDELNEFEQDMINRKNTPVIVNTVDHEHNYQLVCWGMDVSIQKSSDISFLKEIMKALLEFWGDGKRPVGFNNKDHEYAEYRNKMIMAN